MSHSTLAPHSAAYLTESREDWWNDDFLELMARRWDLGSVHKALDVGSGLGHWGQRLLPHFATDAELSGVDFEARWIEGAQERADARGMGERTKYSLGSALDLPFPDNTFDLVTCQTVLIHVPNLELALAEMRRVVVPGGLIAVSEPVNSATSMVLGSTQYSMEVDDLVRLTRFELQCYKGKDLLGEGNNNAACLLPKLFADARLSHINAYQSDRASLVVPPYTNAQRDALCTENGSAQDDSFWIWSKEDTRRYFLAAGGPPTMFEAEWSFALACEAMVDRAFREATEHSLGACVLFLVAGRKPKA